MVDMAGGIGMDIDGIGFNITTSGIITGIKIGTIIGIKIGITVVAMADIKNGKFIPKS